MPSLSKKEVAFFVILWIVQKKVVMNEHKIINDPVFGFIKIRRGLLYDIVVGGREITDREGHLHL